ncbi:hypothetical protein HK101_009921, partial [Irineochytrium annulatum]
MPPSSNPGASGLDKGLISGGTWASLKEDSQMKANLLSTRAPSVDAVQKSTADEDTEVKEEADEEINLDGEVDMSGDDEEEAEEESQAGDEPGDDEEFVPEAEEQEDEMAVVKADEDDDDEDANVKGEPRADSKRGSRSSSRRGTDVNGGAKKSGAGKEEATVPAVKERKQPYNVHGERIYCICRKPDTGTFMINCYRCKDWYHGDCIGVSPEQGKALASYVCDECKELWIKIEADRIERRRLQAEEAAEKAAEEERRPKKKAFFPNFSAFPGVNPSTFWAHGRQFSNPVVQKIATARSAHPGSSKRGSVSSLGSSSTPTDNFIPEVNDVGPDSKAWENDRARMAARKQFALTFEAIKEDKDLTTDGDGAVPGYVLEPEKLAAEVEDEMFDRFSDGAKGFKRACGEKYRSKFRTLQYNLKDKMNGTLRSQVLSGAMSAAILVQLEAGDLANDEIKAKSERIRLESIRNALKPKDLGASIYKKTHKGEEALVDSTVRQPTPEPIVSDEESRVYGVPATGGAYARLASSVACNRDASPSKPAAPIMALDELLAKMDGANTKRRASPTGDSASRGQREKKRNRFENDGGYGGDRMDYDQGYVAANAGSGGMADFGGGLEDAMARDADFDFTGGSTTPPYMPDADDALPPPPPPPLEDDSAADDEYIWTGSVRMQQVGWFAGRCRQVAGRRVGNAKAWEDVLAPAVMIEGRVDSKRMRDYIGLQRDSRSKEVVVVEFEFDEHGAGGGEAGEVGARGGYASLFNYFYGKERYAVVGQNYVAVKDMYIVPVPRHEPLPEMIAALRHCTVPVTERERDMLFGVIILDKNFLNRAVAVASTSAQASSVQARPRSTGPARRAEDPRRRNVPQQSAPAFPQSLMPATSLAGLMPSVSQPYNPQLTSTSNLYGALPGTSGTPATSAVDLLASLAALRN